MKTLALLLISAGVALAQYGNDAPSYPAQNAPVATAGYGSQFPVAVPPIWPVGGHRRHRHHRHSRSWSRSHSRSSGSHSKSDEHHKKKKCNSCRRLSLITSTEAQPILPTDIKYFKDRDGCKNAVISCPFTDGSYTMIDVSVGQDVARATALGVSTQSIATCSKRGEWEILSFSLTPPYEGKVQEFTKVGCVEFIPPA